MHYTYFSPAPRTLDELKAMYRKLAMLHHPDRGGDLETMKRINNEHDVLFEMLKREHNATSDAEHQTTETAEEFRDIINALLQMDGITVELCGRWLWIGGNTRTHKDELKALGCRWSQSKQLWSWHHAEDGARWHKTNYSMNRIRARYGSTIINDDGAPVGATA